jgi:hypothetical protein
MDHDVHSMINIQGLLVFAFAERTSISFFSCHTCLPSARSRMY